MEFTDEQKNELQKAIFTVLEAVIACLEESALTTPDEFEHAIVSGLEDAYGEFLDARTHPSADPAVLKEVAQRMAKLAKRK